MNRLAINTAEDELEASADFCRTEALGLEVTAFASPSNLDGDLRPLVERHINTLRDIAPTSSHGPCVDLIATSFDPAIVEVTRRRHQVSIDAAVQLGAAIYVAHTNYNPMIRSTYYRKNWSRRML